MVHLGVAASLAKSPDNVRLARDVSCGHGATANVAFDRAPLTPGLPQQPEIDRFVRQSGAATSSTALFLVASAPRPGICSISAPCSRLGGHGARQRNNELCK